MISKLLVYYTVLELGLGFWYRQLCLQEPEQAGPFESLNLTDMLLVADR